MTNIKSAGDQMRRPRIFAFSLGLLFNRHLRRMMKANSWRVSLGLPGKGDAVAVWGRKPVSNRGFAIARWRGVPVISFEDGFLRSVETGRQGAAGLSLIHDDKGIYFETGLPNQLHDLILRAQDATENELLRAEEGILRLRHLQLSKYNAFPLKEPDFPDKFVLVIDQTRDDASVLGSGADAGNFQKMLEAAISDHPDLPILIKTHPETLAGKRSGYLDGEDHGGRVQLLLSPISPWQLFDKAQAVYCVSSQLGMEAIFAGHKPVVFGRAFYSGWGLTDDRHQDSEPIAERTAAQLFHAAYMQYCQWYDPYFNRACRFEFLTQILAAQTRAWRSGQTPLVCHGMRLWKRGFLKRYLTGTAGAPRFIEAENAATPAAKISGSSIAVWASKETTTLREKCTATGVPLIRVEDGFLRSRGLGAELVPPLSLAFDDLGIYYDPTRESRLEQLITASANLPDHALRRADEVRSAYVAAGLSKYNLTGELPALHPKPGQKMVLIPGQVEDDASIRLGATKVATNLALIQQTRAFYPDEFLVYKPHPDVQKKLRIGAVDPDSLSGLVDVVVDNADIARLLDRIDIVSTMTSLTGFEALMRGKEVTCFGIPFYAGWGLTRDIGDVPERRKTNATLAGLVHATLIDYPRYWDPVTGKPCPVEVVLERLATGDLGRGAGRPIRALAKLQGVFASQAHWWR